MRLTGARMLYDTAPLTSGNLKKRVIGFGDRKTYMIKRLAEGRTPSIGPSSNPIGRLQNGDETADRKQCSVCLKPDNSSANG